MAYEIKHREWYSHLKDEHFEGVFLIEEDISKALAIIPEGSKTTAEFSDDEKLWFIRRWELGNDINGSVHWVCESSISLTESAVKKLFDLQQMNGVTLSNKSNN